METRMIEFYKELTARNKSVQELGPVPFSQDILDSVRLAMAIGTSSIPCVDRGPAFRNRHMSLARSPDYQHLLVMGKGVKEPAKRPIAQRSSPIRSVYRWPPSEIKLRQLRDPTPMQVVGRCLKKGKGSGKKEKGQMDSQDSGSIIKPLPIHSKMKSHSLPGPPIRHQAIGSA